MTDRVTYTLEDDIAVLTLDDGKANVISTPMMREFAAALDRAAAEAKAVAVIGRPGLFSGGFDLKELMSSPEGARQLLERGADLVLRLYGLEQPLLMGCPGSAVAAGAFLLLTGDWRVGADVTAKIGLNELAIGIPIPHFVVELARDRLDPRHLAECTLGARMHTPAEAREAGFLDELVPADHLRERLLEKAGELAALAGPPFAKTKEKLRGPTLERIRQALAEDLASLTTIG